jgi:hypothetical protein
MCVFNEIVPEMFGRMNNFANTHTHSLARNIKQYFLFSKSCSSPILHLPPAPSQGGGDLGKMKISYTFRISHASPSLGGGRGEVLFNI